MILYRLADRRFSRVWRRNKKYTEKQLLLLAKHNACALEKFKGGIKIKKGDKVVADFDEVAQIEELHENERSSVYAALRNPSRNRLVIHTVRAAVSVANVAGESRGRRSAG